MRTKDLVNLEEAYNKVLNENNYFVVDKKKNDEWLESDISKSGYNYKNRPWAKGFKEEEEAKEYALELAKQGVEVELETPDEGVLSPVNTRYGWEFEVAFT